LREPFPSSQEAFASLAFGITWGLEGAGRSSCIVDRSNLPGNATCYRYFGHYVSYTTYYAVSLGLLCRLVERVAREFTGLGLTGCSVLLVSEGRCHRTATPSGDCGPGPNTRGWPSRHKDGWLGGPQALGSH